VVGEPEVTLDGIREVMTIADLAAVLRQLRRRDARLRSDSQLTYRELAARTGWAHSMIGDYFAGKTLPPTDRFDVLVGLLGATPAEVGALATARDRVEERRRPVAPTPAQETPRAVPRELPRQAAGFVGRDDQLAELDALAEASGGAVVISAVSGTAGVGKTALALRWAHRVADRFPDGCLYVELRGYGPDAPVRPEAALAGFLRGLGVPGTDLPAEVAELAARYRSLLAGRRMLIVLDNARSAGQVRPLLPGTPSCFVLVTSRDRLAGLVARDGAHRINLDLLPPRDAGDLLRELIGPRAHAAPAATAALADRCARLPLALRMAAELATARPTVPLADLVAELDELPKRLDLFDAGGDPETAVREIFAWSYRHLSDGAARMFRLLGLHPGADLDLAAAAALAGTGTAEARGLLGELARAHLLGEARPGRHDLHDLLRAYAAELAGSAGGDDRAATDRLFDHYLTTAAAAVRTLYPAEHDPDPAPGAASFAGTAQALAWLRDELANLVAVTDAAAGSGRPECAVALSATLWRYLDSGGHHGEALAVHGRARQAARDSGDLAGEVAALGELGRVHSRLGRYEDAIEHLGQALAAGAWAAEPDRQASSLNSLAIVYCRLGRYDEALRHFTRALEIYRHTGNRASAGKALGNLGIVNAELGRYPAALAHFGQALDLARAVGDRTGEGDALGNLGHINCLLGHYPVALRQHRDGLVIARATGDRAAEGRMLASLGVVLTRLGRAEARDRLHEALAIHVEAGDRAAEAETMCYLGDVHQRAGQYPRALEHHERALALAEEIGERSVRTRALVGAGTALVAMGRADDAADRFRAAADLAAGTGDRLQHAHALDGLAQCLRATGHPHAAAPYETQARTTYIELGLTP
jgi:tetratricopeptide (TPR) repeat protein/transcriptional regulator with XRE-family HTH domain